MIHTQATINVIKDKNRKKHHNQKTYKKPLRKIGKTIVNTYKIDHEQMKAFSASWWNNWRENDFIYAAVKGWCNAKTEKQKHVFLEYFYTKWAALVPGWRREIPIDMFVQQFNYCIPNFYMPWIEEEKLLKRNRIKGVLFNQILDFLEGKKSIKIDRIFNHLEEEFEATVKGCITRMVKAGYLTEIRGVFYCINSEKVIKDKLGWGVR